MSIIPKFTPPKKSGEEKIEHLSLFTPGYSGLLRVRGIRLIDFTFSTPIGFSRNNMVDIMN